MTATRRAAALPTQPLAVAFQEVRHFQPEDCLHVEPLSVRGQPEGWTIPAHRHQGLHQFQWLAQGRAMARIDGLTQAVQAPAAFLLAPGAVHGFDYSADAQGSQLTVAAPLLRQWLGPEPALLDRLGRSRVFDAAQVDALDAVPALLAQLLAEYRQARSGRVVALQATALLLMLAFARAADAEGSSERGALLRDTLVQRYRALLEQDFRAARPVAAYAAALGVSGDHLSRCCRAVCGQSALAVLHERVLLEARRLLVYTEAPVAEVARSLGFDDSGYFSRFFARASGAPPTAYRARVQHGLVPRPDNLQAGTAAPARGTSLRTGDR